MNAVGERGKILLCRGTRATERRLLAEVETALDRRPLVEMSRPITILVPSRSLREHLLMEVARCRGRAAVGLAIHTVYGYAAEICAKRDGIIPRGKTLTRLVTRRAAAAERELAVELAHLEDGVGAVVPAVRDLLDAGLDESTARRLEERLSALGDERPVRRARCLVAVALSTHRQTERWGAGGASALLRRAARHLRDDEASGAGFATFIHGFADATGAVTEFLVSLVSRRAARVFIDRLLVSSRDGGEAVGAGHITRLLSALARVGDEVEPALEEDSSTRPEFFSAQGPEDEVRGVATRILARLAAGDRAERIAVVARDFASYRLALRSRFGRLGVPFSGVGESGPAGPVSRLAAALATLLARREQAPAERLLDLVAQNRKSGLDPRIVQDVRLAFHALGAARLADVAALDATSFLDAEDRFALLVRQGFRSARRALPAPRVDDERDEAAREGDDEPDRRQPAGGQRRVAGAHMRHAIRATRDALRTLEQWPAEAEVRTHRGWMRGVLEELFGSGSEVSAPVVATVEGVLADLPDALRVGRDELVRTLSSALASCGRPPIGGAGGGVQLLSVTEARARTFDHLFVIGLNRDVFPRVVREDPLLPDYLRRVMQEVLPELPPKLGPGFEEERYLFAQLLDASPVVTLSWQRSDDDGRPRAPSPLLLRRAAVAQDSVTSPRELEAAVDLEELALTAGGRGPRAELAPLLRVIADDVALEIGRSASPAARVHACRLAVLAEMDPDRSSKEGRARARELGPYLGLVGPVADADDPRAAEPYVTGVEKLVACGWQFLLENVLRLERLPDPLAALPSVDPLVLGEVVHGVLEQLVNDSVHERGADSTLDQAIARAPRELVWPVDAMLENWLHDAAGRAVRDAGAGLPGMAALYVELARPQVEVARAVDWTARGVVPVLGAEVVGRLTIGEPGDERAVRFRVDRVDRLASGLRLTDYKTGHQRVSSARQPEKRRQHLLQALREGRLLQPAVYALAAGAPAVGRLLYLAADTAAELREVGIDASDGEVAAAVRDVVADAFRALVAGSLLPRVVAPDLQKEPRRCDHCRVAEACVRGDSGARGRIAEWVRRRRVEAAGLTEPESAWLALWERGGGGARAGSS